MIGVKSEPRAGPSRGLRGQAPHRAKVVHFYAATWPVFGDSAKVDSETVRAFLDADKEVSALAPATLAGAVALLSCHVAVQRDRAAAGRGEEVPSIVHYIHTHALVEDAFAALERLAPGVRS